MSLSIWDTFVSKFVPKNFQNAQSGHTGLDTTKKCSKWKLQKFVAMAKMFWAVATFLPD